MCLLCAEIQRDKLTAREIARNYREMSVHEVRDHWAQIVVELDKKGRLEEVAEELRQLLMENSDDQTAS